MIKKIINLIIITIVITIGTNMCYNITYAADTVDKIMGGAQDFLNEGKDMQHGETEGDDLETTGTVLDQTKLKITSDFIYYLLLAFAIITAVIVGMVIGIKFMVSSIEEKAKVKESLMAYVVGCVVVFGAFGIWKLAVTVLSSW